MKAGAQLVLLPCFQASSVTPQVKTLPSNNTVHCESWIKTQLPKKGICLYFCRTLFWTPLQARAWSSLEIVQFITQWVLSLHGLSFSLWSLKRAEAGRPIGKRELLARPIRALHFLNSPPIVWPSVGGPSRREQGGTLPLECVKGCFRDRM